MNSDKELLYSRQIAVYGNNAMNKISQLQILIYGVRGLGLEISKNIILAGPKKVTILDNNKIVFKDLGTNFYLKDNDIGKRRDETSLSKLKELNYNVKCDFLKEGKIQDIIDDYDVIVISEIMEIDEIIKINNICHEKKKGFIYCMVFGLSFFCFVDYCQHTIKNSQFSENKTYCIKNIIKGKNTIIEIDNELEEFELSGGDFIIFKEIKGMKQMLDGKKRKIKKVKKNKFEIEEDSTEYDDYIQGGIIEEVIDDIFVFNETFEKMINKPLTSENILNPDEELNMHLAFLTLHEFFKINKKLPENDKDELINIMKLLNKIKDDIKNDWYKNLKINEEFLIDIFKYSNCQISPICSYAGGVVSQEIIKYIGIYKTINQWFRAEFTSILDKGINNNIILTRETRYKDQILIFGDETQKNIENLNIFLVGAGAVGCEILKNLAMMGACTNKNSLLTVTDHDRIEKSNLNRQFLFRENDISKLKSECAIEAIKEMNKNINCKFMEEFVDKNTQNIFNKEFFEKQNAVIIAVDSYEGRTYISELCEEYKVPYFNCGTEGPYANVEAFIPGIIEKASYPVNYNKIVPQCTLRMYPSSINHCVLWALDHFEKYFNYNIKNIETLQNNIDNFYNGMNKIKDLRTRYHKMKNIFELLKIANKQDFVECVKIAIKKYLKFFNHNIIDLLKIHPPEKINKETGLRYWTGNKKMPHPLDYNIYDNQCYEFIKSFSSLLAECLGIDIKNINLKDYIEDCAEKFKEFDTKEKIFEKKAYYENNIKKLKDTINLYIKYNNIKNQFHPKKYEKDTQDINEINYIYYSSILRAKNYDIKEESKIKIKIIAGKIMPSIITSTSAISGLLALQLYVICQKSNCRCFRTGVIDLSDNTLSLAIPLLIK